MRDAAILEAVLRHVFDRPSKPKKQVPTGMLGETGIAASAHFRTGNRRQQITLEVGRNTFAACGHKMLVEASACCGAPTQVRMAAVRIGLLSSTPRSILFRN